MVKKNEKDTQKGVVAFVLGLCSIVFAQIPLLGLASGIIGLVFSKKQNKIYSNGLNTAGKILSIIGIILSSIITVVLIFIVVSFFVLASNFPF